MEIIASELNKRIILEYLQQYQSINLFPGFNQIEVNENDNQVVIKTNDNYSFKSTIPKTNQILMDEVPRLIFYDFFRNYFKKELNWGILSGVKPVKLYRKIERMGLDPDYILTHHFHLNSKKVNLLKDINNRQRDFLDQTKEDNHISIYLGIPICPQRCSYCSFVSTILDPKRLLLTDYLENLKKEIDRTADIVNRNGLIVDTFYIGGGTPSILNANEADILLNQLKNQFDVKNVREFTFEAGRPETTTPELLQVLKSYDINRICLNPQTMNQETLNSINRSHTVQDILDKYKLIREIGFNSVNMDLIVGLNNETEEQFIHSLDEVIKLRPENLTVHNLSIKKGSYLNEINGKKVSDQYSEEFFENIRSKLLTSNYFPYYLYRQKYTIGNGENIGYSLPNKESLYNILMMAEEQTIFGIGAGSSGKLYNSSNDRFSHVFTVKDIRTYNQRTDEIINKKINDYQSFLNNRISNY